MGSMSTRESMQNGKIWRLHVGEFLRGVSHSTQHEEGNNEPGEESVGEFSVKRDTFFLPS